jgi:predicted acylesterase/phospholipase RssA
MDDFASAKDHLQDAKSYDHPELECDLVLKGGITSGVVYPLAICELARSYQFRNLGGTSAGALAAALAAAAEKGRTSQRGGFSRLARLPDELGRNVGGKTGLLRLFQPQPGTRHLFSFLLAVLEVLRHNPKNHKPQSGFLRALEVGLGLLARGWWAYATRPLRFGLTASSAALIVGFGLAESLIPLWLRLLAGLFVLLLLEVLFLVGFVGFDLVRALPANSYGLCTGLEGVGDPNQPALTTWLTDLLDEVSGKSDVPESAVPESAASSSHLPLTFGDLWGPDDTHRQINLQIITTSLTHARPYTVPFEAKDLYFKPTEMRALFPERVVSWLVQHARASDTAEQFGLYALPNPRDLPVVVAVRLSLSFPLLVSAVKLYTVDRTRPTEQQAPEPCWFSDGGMTSNFPVHFFDAPLPHRPTFAINLRGFRDSDEQSDDESKNVFIPANRRQGRFLTLSKINSLGNFLSQLFNTLQNWSDNTLVPVEGFRERIVHVKLNPSEGGANLNMEPATLNRLSERGWYAGKTLVNKFTANSRQAFDDHRWTRFTLSLSTLQVWLEAFSGGYSENFKRVIQARAIRGDATDTALETAAQLRGLVNHWNEKGVRFEVWYLTRGESERAKHIEAELRIRPRL